MNGGSGNGSLYPGGSGSSGYGVGNGNGSADNGVGFRSATPNSRGQYSAAVLEELESQNENEHTGMLLGKVKQLKDVRRRKNSYFHDKVKGSGHVANAYVANTPHRRRNPRLNLLRRENERPV